MTAVVRVENLSKYYGRHRAVHNVSFSMERGEVLGFLGPNGSGKTTILRILTGYLHASAGRVSVAGFDIVEDGIEARKHIGYVPEDAPLYVHMRVVEALKFMGKLKGLTGAQLESQLADVREQLSLQPVWHRAVGKLSRGYRQRVAIAQALLNRPALLVLDEPTNGLDPRQIIELRELIMRLAQHHAILITSHILAEIERVASRVLILLDGQLLTNDALRRGDGSTSVTLRARVGSADIQAVLMALQAVTGVTRVHHPAPVSDNTADYVLELESQQAISQIAPAILGAGFSLISLGEVQWDLESLFLEMTGGPGQ